MEPSPETVWLPSGDPAAFPSRPTSSATIAYAKSKPLKRPPAVALRG